MNYVCILFLWDMLVMRVNIQFEPRTAMVIGALVADAASLGLHWIYDPDRIRQIEKDVGLVFLQPDANHYSGVKGYFAHGNKQAGEFSGYGENCLQILKHLSLHGEFDRRAYQQEFCAYFGPGGEYIGYVDSPTRKALNTLLTKDIKSYPEKSGADDDQLLALATIPVLVARHRGSLDSLMALIETVVRITNNNDLAVSAAQCIASVLSELRDGASLREAMTQAVPHAGKNLSNLLRQSLAINDNNSQAAAAEFGSACHVVEGLPVVFHIANHAPDYITAIQENIRVGGDSCGRAIVLGAIMATHRAAEQNLASAIPFSWVIRSRNLQVAVDALESIV
jgi:ADP-ribosylglycohydrolase